MHSEANLYVDSYPEQSEDEFFHHPTWPHPWSHPDFDAQSQGRWLKKRWFRQDKRFASCMLRAYSGYRLPWGYIFYRTVYTPESNQLWQAALEKVSRYIHWGIDTDIRFDREKLGKTLTPERLVHESYKDVIIEDKQRWESASLEMLRLHFQDYLHHTKLGVYGSCPRYEVCLVIDEPALHSIIAAPEPGEPSLQTSKPGFVGVLDARFRPSPTFNPSRSDAARPLYPGYMRAELDTLAELALRFSISTFKDLCSYAPPGQIPVYDGCVGKIHDVEGNIQEYPTLRGKYRA